MPPILIDKRDLIKLGLISVLTTVIVFAAGFLSGYQQAETLTLALPVQAVLLESDVEPQLPDIIVAGAEIDVDQPQVEKANAKNSVVASKVHTSSNKEKDSKTNERPASKKPASREQQGKSANKVSSDDKAILNKSNQFSVKEPGFMVVTSLTSAELNSIKVIPARKIKIVITLDLDIL